MLRKISTHSGIALDDVEITIDVRDGAACGHQAPVGAVDHFLRNEGFTRPLLLRAESEEVRKKIDALSIRRTSSDEEASHSPKRRRLTVVPAFDDISSEERKKLSETSTTLLLQTYQWSGSPPQRLLLYRSKDSTHQETPLAVENHKALYPLYAADIRTAEDIPSALEGIGDPSKAEGLKVFLEACLNGKPCMLVYGLHALACPEQTLHTLLQAIHILAEEKDTQVYVLVIHKQPPRAWLPPEGVSTCSLETLHTEKEASLEDVRVVHLACDSVPQKVFYTLCKHLTWPMVLEGANTMNAAVWFGKRFLPLGSKNNPLPVCEDPSTQEMATGALKEAETFLRNYEDSPFYALLHSTQETLKKLFNTCSQTQDPSDEGLYESLPTDVRESVKTYLQGTKLPQKPPDESLKKDEGIEDMNAWELSREAFVNAFVRVVMHAQMLMAAQEKGVEERAYLQQCFGNDKASAGVADVLRRCVSAEDEGLAAYFKDIHSQASDDNNNQLKIGFEQALEVLGAS